MDISFDFALILVGLTLITGAVAVYEWVWGRRKRRARHGDDVVEPLLIEYSRSLFPIIFVVTVLRSFFIEPFQIPSGSMMSTLLTGDFILVNKYAYGIRLPVSRTKVVEVGKPARGDVVVFRHTKETGETIDYIKRVIGLPGDRIRYRNKQVYINGKPATLQFMQSYRSPDVAPGTRRLREDLGTVKHDILVSRGNKDREFKYNDVDLKEGEYFVMGDNRDNSNDSRTIGPIKEENLVGRAFLIWMHMRFHRDDPSSFFPDDVDFRFDRIGEPIE